MAQDISSHQFKSSPSHQQDSYLLTTLVSMEEHTDTTDSLLGEATNRVEGEIKESASVTVDTDQNSGTTSEPCQSQGKDQAHIESLLLDSV